MSSERAGVHTRGALNREQARDVATGIARGEYDTAEDAVDALEVCVVPDPRLARIKALLDEAVTALRRKGDGEQLWTDAAEACIAMEDALAILRGDQ